MAVPEGVLSWLWVAATCVVLPAAAGRAVLAALGLGNAPGAVVLWCHGYVVGQGMAAVLVALWLWAGQPVPGLVIPFLLAAVACCRRRRPAAAPARWPPWLRVAVVFVVVAFVFACLRTNVLPIHHGDEGEMWTAKAKVLYGRPMGSLAAALPWVGHADYPSLNPLLQVSAFAASGRVLHTESRLPLQAFGIVVVLLLAGGVAARTRQWFAVAAVVACAATLGSAAATSAYADTLLACTLLATVDALVRWRDEGDPAWWRVACIAAGTMLASKNEGLMWTALVSICACATSWSWFRQRRPLRRRELGWLLVPIAVVLAGQVFNAVHGLHNDLVGANAAGRGPFGRLLDHFDERVPMVFGKFGRMLVDPAPHRLLPALCVVAGFVAALAGGRRFLQSQKALVVGCVVGGLVVYMTVFLTSPSDVGWHLAVAAERIVEHLVPLAAYGCCLTIAPVER
jgi:hypothetical protein